MRLVQALSPRGGAARPFSSLDRRFALRARLALLTLGLAWAPLATAAVRTAGSCESLPGGVIEVEGTGGSGTQPTGYATLGAAFTAINTGVHTGAIVIDVCGNTTEGTASAVLNASGAGSASYTTITISPAGGAVRTISGATTAGSPMIDFNGADNVTVDGLNSGGNALTISNTTVAATSGTSTIRFQADATGNLLTRLRVLGSATMAVGTNGGNIWFGSAAISTGNDNNTVSNCFVGPAGTNTPSKAIYFSGSSNTHPGTANSGIVINNNDIHDYFSPTVSSAGIDLNSGTVGTTISNNRFYQLSPRGMTTTNLTHSGIRINNTNGNAYQITGNLIGGTSTVYELGFPASTSGGFIPINLAVGTATATTIDANTIAQIGMTGGASGTSSSAPFRGIYVSSGLATATNNTVGSLTTPGNITYTSSSASASDVIAIFNFGSSNWTTTGNNIGGISVSNSSTGAANVFGLRTNTVTGASWICTNNTVGGTSAGFVSTSTATGSTVQGIRNDAPGGTFTGNSVRNLKASGGTGTGASASVLGIVVNSATPSHTLSQNSIIDLANTNPTAASVVTAIQFTGGSANVVERNLIRGIYSFTNSAAAEVNGIRIAGGTTVYRNNMIAIGDSTGAAIGAAASNTSTTGINGINETGGSNSIWHNSVFIYSTAASGGGASYAFNQTVTGSTRSVRNNIFFNSRSNGSATGSHYAIKLNGTAPAPAGLTVDNNLYFANGAGSVLGFYNSLNVTTLGAWRTAVGQDASSFVSNPNYADTGITPDLHLSPFLTTLAEGNGFDVGVTDDFDGEIRSGLTPVDIGADAGNYMGVDLQPPSISYTLLANTASTANRTLAATITDVSGVATGANAPRAWFRKGAGSYFSTACALASGTVNNGVWNCLIDNATIGGVVSGDLINYFVVAQDVGGLLASNPAGAVGTNVNTITTPPAAPNAYTIVEGLSGTLNVGPSETLTSLTSAGGLFAFINARVLVGNLTVNITGDLTIEDGSFALNQWVEEGAGGYTLLIRPSGAPRLVSGSLNGALIRLVGADRVRIDGSTTGGTATGVGGNPALRELTIRNTNTGTSTVAINVGSGSNGAQGNTLRNLIVEGNDPTTSLAAITLGGNAPGTAGTDNDNNRVENCAVRRAIYGVYSAGQNAANPNAGTVIARNDVSASGADRIRRIGIVVFAESGVQIVENQVGNIDTNESADAVAIGIGAQNIDATLTTTGNVTAALVARNRIHTVLSQSAIGFSAVGIAVAGGSGSANVIVNNMVSGVSAPATSPDLVAGVYVAGVTGSGTRLLHNSVYLTGDRGTVATQMPGFGIAITGADPTVEVKDNAIVNAQVASGGGANARAYAIGMVSTTFANLDANYNSYFASGAQAGHFRTGSLGAGLGTDYATVALWGAAVSDDANSLQVDPPFVSTSDLHLQPGSTLIGAGTPVGVTDDIDGQTRSATAPTIGADEPPLADLAISKSDGVISAAPGASVTYTIQVDNLAGPNPATATVADTFAPILDCNWSCAVFGGATCGAGGSGNINDAVNLPVGGVVVYTAICAISPAAPAGNLINTATVTNTGGTVDPNLANNSATDTDVLTPSADLSITKTNGVTNSTPGLTTTYTIVASNAGPSDSPFVTVTDTFPPTLTNCSWTCTGSGATCAAGALGNINDTFAMPAGSSATYTATCTIAPATTGSLSNTASITGSVADPNNANNSATDTDNLVQNADLQITKTDGVTTATPGGSVTYTINVANAGPSGNIAATVTDNFPATLTCAWTCSATAGSTCPAGGSGNIGATVNLQSGGVATFVASCNISPAATGSLVNTASVASAADTTPGNNSATDTDTLTPQADLQITKTNGVSSVTAGGSTTYTIVASNNGPSNTTGTVADTFPATLTCTWTCVGAGGGTCTASGSGNINNAVNLPAGGSVTHTATCAISGAASGTLSNTATVTGAATDPVPGNNSATDADPVTVCPATVVTNSNDAGPGSLRQVVADACAGSTVTFAPGVTTVSLTTARLLVDKNLTIDGSPGVTVTRAAGSPAFRIFQVSSGSTVLMSRLTVTNGSTGFGGGINNAGTLTLEQSAVRANTSTSSADGGGGIFNSGTLTVIDSVIADNTAAFLGGGLWNRGIAGPASATLSNSLIANNQAASGGGIHNYGASLVATNTTISGNRANIIDPTGGAAGIENTAANFATTTTLVNCTFNDNQHSSSGDPTADDLYSGNFGTQATVQVRNTIFGGSAATATPNLRIFAGGVITSQGNNLSSDAGAGLLNQPGDLTGVDPLLAPIGLYGGPTPTHALLPGSPAINAGNGAGAPPNDQRGIARPQLGTVDIGAYESRGFGISISSGNNQSTGVGTAFANPLVVSVTPIGAGEPVNGGVVSFTPPPSGASATLSPNPATIAAGLASTNATANGSVGTYQVAAGANGGGSINFTLTNISLATTTTITGDAPDPSVTGQPYTVNVQVATTTQSPAGTVTISDGTGATCGPVTLVAGTAPNSTASCNLTSTTAGAKTLTATYTPASGLFQPSSGTASHLVNPAATTISVSGPARSRINQPTAFNFVLAVAPPGAGTPTGTVTLSSGAASCTATLPATSCNLVFASLGARTVSASYAGDGNFAASTSSGAGNAQTLVYALSDIAVSKSDGIGHYEPGDLIVYTVLVRNLGPDGAANIRVRDDIPAGLANVVWSCDASGGAVCPVAGGSGSLDVIVATLPSGGVLGFTFYGIVSGSPSQIVNTAFVELPADTTIEDPALANNSATDTDLLEFLFRNGFEDAQAAAASGAFVLPGAALRLVLNETAVAVYTLDDKDGVAARVYARVWAGELQYALASRGAGGALQLGAWRSYPTDPTLRWTAGAVDGAWRVVSVDLR